jgi:adenylosuccinate lyase
MENSDMISEASLLALCPLDGRYQQSLQTMREIFSEFGLIKARLHIEVRWLQTLANYPQIKEITPLSESLNQALETLLTNFSLDDARTIKTLEQTTNHDVKAIEYFLKDFILKIEPNYPHAEFIHFAATSEDINNLAYGLMLTEGRDYFLKDIALPLLTHLRTLSQTHAATPMLARTHGQPASPTTVGKEFTNVYERLRKALMHFHEVSITGKFNGAVGNFNAHHVSYPEIDWITLSENFIVHLGLKPNLFTTQIEPHDELALLCKTLASVNTILLDFNRDCWGYISLNYFSQKTKDGEIGSSTMPHKVNPIDFENSEGNLGLANSLLHYFSEKLPISRFQRDLSDSTVQRNMGLAFGYSLLAYQATLKGLNKIIVNTAVLNADLDNHIEVLAEAIQTVMRRYEIEAPYEKLKQLTRGQTIDQTQLHTFIKTLDLPQDVKENLLTLQAKTYTGLAKELVEKHLSPLPTF